MQVGDNMLAIYASEKALRLAERLGEVRAASRAHGIFGRVFGRIGDTAKARENLERAIELAKDSDENETVLAMLALGHHLENAEGDYAAAESPLPRSARAGAAHRRRARPDRAARRARPAGLLSLLTGSRSRARTTPSARAGRTRGAGRQAVPVLHAARAAALARRRLGGLGRAVRPRPASSPSRSAGRRSPSTRCSALAVTQRDRGDLAAARGHDRAGAGRVRARRPGRAVDPGDLDARPDARAGGRARRAPGGGRAGLGARQARPLPARRGRRARGARR